MNHLNRLITLIFFLQTVTAFCTDVPAGNVSGTWSASGNPYVVNGNIRVPAGESLTIEPGTEIQFSGAYFLRVLGNCTAAGVEGDSIVFTSTASNVTWRGIKMDSLSVASDTVRFSHCNMTKMQNIALLVLNTSKVIIEHCRIHNNTQLYGASINTILGNPIYRYNYFHNNAAAGGGYHGGALRITDASPLIEGNTFRYNTAPSGDHCISIWRTNVTPQPVIRNNLFDNNDGVGPCAIGVHTNGLPLIEGNTFSNNHASYDYGSIWIAYVQVGIVQVLNNTFTGNSASASAGCIKVTNSRVNFEGNHFENNTCNVYGSALYATDESELSISECTFIDNGNGLSGGVVYVESTSDIQMNRCLFRNNGAAVSPLYLYAHVTGNITNSIFVNNTASSSGNIGGAVYLTLDCSPAFSNCVFANNAGIQCGAVTLYHDSSPTFTNCIFWGNDASSQNVNVKVQDYIWHYCNPSFYNCVVGGGQASFFMGTSSVAAYENCIETDPLFVEPTLAPGYLEDAAGANWNVWLETSPCIDAGSGSIESLSLGEFDFAGNSRLQGSALDIGAYEGGFLIVLADLDGNGDVNLADLLLFNSMFGCTADCGSPDMNDDGVVNVMDLFIFLSWW